MYEHDFADIAEERAGLAYLYGLVECEARCLEELLRVFIDLTDGVRLVQVRMKAWSCVSGLYFRKTSEERTIIVHADVYQLR